MPLEETERTIAPEQYRASDNLGLGLIDGKDGLKLIGLALEVDDDEGATLVHPMDPTEAVGVARSLLDVALKALEENSGEYARRIAEGGLLVGTEEDAAGQRLPDAAAAAAAPVIATDE